MGSRHAIVFHSKKMFCQARVATISLQHQRKETAMSNYNLCRIATMSVIALFLLGMSAMGQTRTFNMALPQNGGTVSASSTYGDGTLFPATNVVDGDRSGIGWGDGAGGWSDGTSNTFPDWLEVDFDDSKNISEIDVFTLQDNITNPLEPTLDMEFSLYGVTDFA